MRRAGLARAALLAVLATLAAPVSGQEPADAAHDDHHGAHQADPADPAQQAAPRTPIPALTDADRAAAVPATAGHPAHDDAIHGFLRFDRIEAWDADDARGQAWDVDGWLGTDTRRLWLRSEGERTDGRTEGAELQLLAGRSITAWWDVVAGVRHDFRPRQARTFAALGIQGLSPYWFETQFTAYVGEGGRTAARFDAHYDMHFSGRLILQWQFEADAYGKTDATRGIGRGFSTVESGARLRYEFDRRFAPYVGIAHERAFGRTAGLRRDAGEGAGETRLVLGLRTWF